MFDNPDGPISIIYRFIQIKKIYKFNLNLICKSIYFMISDQMHIRKDIICDAHVYTLTYIKDICKNKKISLVIINTIHKNLYYIGSQKCRKCVKLLLEDTRVDIHKYKQYTISWAYRHGYDDIINFMEMYISNLC